MSISRQKKGCRNIFKLIGLVVVFLFSVLWIFSNSQVNAEPAECIAPTGNSIYINAPISPTRVAETASRDVTLYFTSASATQMMISNTGFMSATWTPYATNTTWRLTEGDGLKWVYAKFRSACGAESATFSASITLRTPTSTCVALIVPDGALYVNGVRWGGNTASRNVTLTVSGVSGATDMMVSESVTFVGGIWEQFTTSKAWTLSAGNGEKRLYAKFRSACGVTRATTVSWITLNEGVTTPTPTPSPLPILPSPSPTCSMPTLSGRAIQINDGADAVYTKVVNLSFAATDADYVTISNNSDFSDSMVKPYQSYMKWWLLPILGTRNVYVKFSSACGSQTPVYSDSIFLQIKPDDASSPAPTEFTTTLITPTPQNSSSTITFSEVSVRQPEEDVIEDESLEEDVESVNRMTFSYIYRNNAGRAVNVRITRSIMVLRDGLSIGRIRNSSARVWMRAGASYKTKKITETLPDGTYSVMVEVKDARTGRTIDWNSFNITLPTSPTL